MSDIYDQEIAYLTENPWQIYKHWNWGTPLFQKAVNLNHLNQLPLRIWQYGCLTQIRQVNDSRLPPFFAETPILTEQIIVDDRIPASPSKPSCGDDENKCTITLEHLPVFAEWQRKLDKELDRTPPQTYDWSLYG